jgi:hypothetical protein
VRREGLTRAHLQQRRNGGRPRHGRRARAGVREAGAGHRAVGDGQRRPRQQCLKQHQRQALEARRTEAQAGKQHLRGRGEDRWEAPAQQTVAGTAVAWRYTDKTGRQRGSSRPTVSSSG